MTMTEAPAPGAPALEAQLAELEATAQRLAAEQAEALTAIAGNLAGKATAAESRYATIAAKLAAIPQARAALQAQRDQALKDQARAAYEKACSERYTLQAQAEAMQPDMDRAAALLKQLQDRQHALNQQAAEMQHTMTRLQKTCALSPGELASIQTTWDFIPANYPERAQIMLKRLERGHVPPPELEAVKALAAMQTPANGQNGRSHD